MGADGHLFDHTIGKVILRLQRLEADHRALDQKISQSQADGVDMLTIQRLKREKLRMKDQISMLRGSMTPDIIA